MHVIITHRYLQCHYIVSERHRYTFTAARIHLQIISNLANNIKIDIRDLLTFPQFFSKRLPVTHCKCTAVLALSKAHRGNLDFLVCKTRATAAETWSFDSVHG